MGSTRLAGATYTYIMTYPDSYSLTPSNVNTLFRSYYVPTITRTWTSDVDINGYQAVTRYFGIIITRGTTANPNPRTTSCALALYKAVFAKGSTTATVTGIDTANWNGRLGRLGEIKLKTASDAAYKWGYNSGLGYVGYTSQPANYSASSFASGASTPTLNVSGFNPSVSLSSSTSSSINAQFGLVQGYWSATFSGTANSTWAYTNSGQTNGDFVHSINATTSLTVSANGKTGTSSGTGSRSASASTGTLATTSITGNLSATNNLGGSASTSKTLTAQNYYTPTCASLKLERSATAGRANYSLYYSVAGINKSSTAQATVTYGTVLMKYYILNKAGQAIDGSESSPKTITICANGSALSSITGTRTGESEYFYYDEEASYTMKAWIVDRLGNSSPVLTVTLPTVYATMDVYPEGTGVAFGGVSEGDGLVSYMGLKVASGDVYFPLDTNASTGTTDGDLYKAIKDLGWENDVIV